MLFCTCPLGVSIELLPLLIKWLSAQHYEFYCLSSSGNKPYSSTVIAAYYAPYLPFLSRGRPLKRKSCARFTLHSVYFHPGLCCWCQAWKQMLTIHYFDLVKWSCRYFHNWSYMSNVVVLRQTTMFSQTKPSFFKVLSATRLFFFLNLAKLWWYDNGVNNNLPVNCNFWPSKDRCQMNNGSQNIMAQIISRFRVRD